MLKYIIIIIIIAQMPKYHYTNGKHVMSLLAVCSRFAESLKELFVNVL